MKRNRRTLTGLLIGLAVSVAALAVVLQWSGFDPLVQALSQVDLRIFGLAVVVYLVSMLARAASWHTLLGKRFSIWRVLAALNEGYLLNNIFPWRLGELGRAVLLGRRSKMSTLGVLSTIMVERLYDITLALSLLIALLPTAVGVPGATRNAIFAAGVFSFSIAGLFIAVRNPAWVGRLISLLPVGRSRLSQIWDRFKEGLEVLRDPRNLLVSFAWMLASWALAGLEYWLVLRSVIPEAEPVWAFFMLTVTLLGVAVPTSPGYIGAFEFAGVLALSAFGIPRAQALAASVILHAMVFVVASSLGALALANEGESIKGLYREAVDWFGSSPAREVE